MQRLEKKCLLASTVTHGAAVLIFLICSAFILPKDDDKGSKPLTMVAGKLVFDQPTGGGGNPTIAPSNERQRGDTMVPQPRPPEPAPVVKPQPAPTPPAPAPPAPVVKETRRPDPVRERTPPVDKPSVEKAPVRPPKEKEVAKASDKPLFVPVEPKAKATPSSDFVPTAKPTRDLVREAQEAAAARARESAARQREADARVARQAGGALEKLRTPGFADGTAAEVSGPGGEAYINYLDLLHARYNEAWRGWQTLTDEDSTALVQVTVSRAGHVIESRILRRARDSGMNRSVQATLDRVRFIAPFPEGTRDAQRTFTIEFNLKAKRAAA